MYLTRKLRHCTIFVTRWQARTKILHCNRSMQSAIDPSIVNCRDHYRVMMALAFQYVKGRSPCTTNHGDDGQGHKRKTWYVILYDIGRNGTVRCGSPGSSWFVVVTRHRELPWSRRGPVIIVMMITMDHGRAHIKNRYRTLCTASE